jgi:hypothetical protein
MGTLALNPRADRNPNRWCLVLQAGARAGAAASLSFPWAALAALRSGAARKDAPLWRP